jgi:predicted alpha/beta superfamily hydrolase
MITNIRLIQYPHQKFKDLLPRDVWVWTPPQYQENPTAHFPVIYMHDGQNLFDPQKAHTGVTWGVAEMISKLSAFKFIQPAIVAGIDNTSNRFGDYMPTKPFETVAGKAFLRDLGEKDPEFFIRNDFVANDYLKLIVTKIKPRIDNAFRTKKAIQDTFIVGSSMGGLISLYALVEYPHIFGGAACFSTHWPILGEFMQAYLREYLPDAGSHKLYFDHGTLGLDEAYGPFQKAVDSILVEKGYLKGRDWLTRIAPRADHNETAWRDRLHIALRFLLSEH